MDPILATLVQSNEPLSEQQALHVRQTLDENLSSLSGLKEEIPRVLLSLLKLEKERRIRSENAATLKGVLSPIRRIPSEILAEIFLLGRSGTFSSADPRSVPMLLGHVSSRWRQVSRSSPRLWDHLHISPNSGRRYPPEDILRSMLASSCILPLHVHLRMSGPVSTTGLVAEDVLDLLFQQHHRLKAVHLELTSINLPPRTFNKRSLPILSSIRIMANEDVDIAYLLTSFNDAPQLRSVYLYAPDTPMDSLMFTPEWSQLTRLVLCTRIGLHDARYILIQSEMIQECQLIEVIASDDFAPSQNMHRLNHLQNLTIFIEHDLLPGTFFDAFSFPKLDSLNIMAHDWSPDILPNLYDRSNFSLTSLQLRYMDLRSEDLILFLRNLSELEILHLSHCGVDDALFRAFTYDPGNPLPPFALRRLGSLRIFGTSDNLNGAWVADMAESMLWHSGDQNDAFPTLETVDMYLEGPRFDDEAENRLKYACDFGPVKDHSERE
ncbi:hypothetical protein FB451DRAFT_1367139 [Mycena latifolia]|nr:hypothetical protein FB451DRAFT_1367139 [Mycena latifolia]